VALAAATVIAAVPRIHAVPRTAERAPARVEASDDSRVVFRVDLQPYSLEPGRVDGTVALNVPGFIRRGEPGEPLTLSRQFLVALPPSGDYSVSWRVLASTPLGVQRLEPNPYPDMIRDEELGRLPTERYEIDPAVYGAFQSPPTVSAENPVYIRRQRALPVWVNPVSFDPASGNLVLATSVEVTATFRPSQGRERQETTPESPIWDDVFGRLFVNPGQAAKWRAAPRFTRAGLSAGLSAPEATLQGPHVRLSVRETGVQKVTAAALVNSGFPAGQAISDLHLFRRTYDEETMLPGVRDVAFTVEEGALGTPDYLDGDDLLVFYGRRLRDDPEQGDPYENFADHNVYWLGTTSGPMMATRSLSPGFVTADTATASFPAKDHFELDVIFREPTPPGVGDFYYQNYGTEAGPVDLPLRVGYLAPGATLDIRADLHGDRYAFPRTIKVSLVNSAGTVVLDPTLGIPNKNRVLFQQSVPGASVVPGVNTFRIERPPDRSDVQVLINWVEVSYDSRFRAMDNTLRFNTGVFSGDTSLTVTGLSDTGVWLLDVTDPDAPVRCATTQDLFVPVESQYALSFRDNVAARKDYIVIPESKMVSIPEADIEFDTPSTIIGNEAEGGVDVLVVSNALFVSGMQEWVTYRRAQGYRVYMVDVQDVFDEFNNGVPNARAIDRFVQRFYELGNASTLLLVGDASEDAKRIHSTSGVNFVPTHAAPDHVAALLDDEVVTSDKRYVKLPGPGGTVDPYPDMMIGRLPVGDTFELQRVLNKIFAYEKPQASDFWRKRMIIIADDAYSAGNSTFGGAQLCYHGSEVPFQSGQERTAKVIEGSLPAGYDVVRFYLSDYTGPIHQQTCIPQYTAMKYVRENANPPLMNELDQGATLVTIQAHMNQTLVTHEKLLTVEPATTTGSTYGRDHLRLTNRGKYFVMFGMGCHFCDYALHKEQVFSTVRSPNGDCIGEQFLLANNIGAVATYGSSGFEYLGQTNAFMDMVSWVWFYDAPYDTMINQTEGQWVFGKLMFLVENEMALAQQAPVEHYHILGDPMLRIDAGPPAFDVTVDGAPFESGNVVGSGGEGDTIHVDAVVTDENAIQDFSLTIDGVDRTDDMTATQLADTQLVVGRQYRLTFAHKLIPKTYDIVLRAFQAPDTTAGQYHMAAEFTIRVESSVTLSVNGRTVQSGDVIPGKGDYLVQLKLPVVVPQDSVSVTIDDDPVLDATLNHPSQDDSTTWLIRFSRNLPDGEHVIVIQAGVSNRFEFDLRVSSEVGLRAVLNYPNPFEETTTFFFTNDVEISDGTIDIFTVSGRRVRRLVIPPESRAPGQNTVFWDGRDGAGSEIANGVYLYVIKIKQGGKTSTIRGKLAHIR